MFRQQQGLQESQEEQHLGLQGELLREHLKTK